MRDSIQPESLVVEGFYLYCSRPNHPDFFAQYLGKIIDNRGRPIRRSFRVFTGTHGEGYRDVKIPELRVKAKIIKDFQLKLA